MWTASTLVAWPLLGAEASGQTQTDSTVWSALLGAIGGGLDRVPSLHVAKAIAAASSAAVMVMMGALGRPSATSRTHALLAVALILVFASPTSQRWLQDGTEIGALVAAAVACAWAVDRWLSAAPTSERVLLLGVAAALPAILRIDAAPIGVATLLAARALDRQAWAPALATTLALVLPIWAWTHLTTGSWSVVPLQPGALATEVGATAWRWPADLVHAALWTNPWWIAGALALLVFVTRPHALRRVAVFGLLPLFASVWFGWSGGNAVAATRGALPALAFAWAVALVLERHTGALARRLERPRARRLWLLALALGLAHTAITWPSMRARSAAAALDFPQSPQTAALVGAPSR